MASNGVEPLSQILECHPDFRNVHAHAGASLKGLLRFAFAALSFVNGKNSD
jgi:hypothetical protein